MKIRSKNKIKSVSTISIIDDGNLRGFITPANCMPDERFNLIMEDVIDTDPKFLAKTHKEYKEAKNKNLLISSANIKKKISL